VNHAAHVLANMAGEGPLSCKDAGCEGSRAEPWPRCPRCTALLIRDVGGDACCYVCGCVVYGTAPNERKPMARPPKCGRVVL